MQRLSKYRYFILSVTVLVFCSSSHQFKFQNSPILNETQDAIIEISEGKGHEKHVSPPLAPTQKLGESVISHHLNRLEQIDEELDTTAFSLRESTQPAPRSGTTVESEFPSTEDLAPPTSNQLHDTVQLSVLRVAPEGDVPLAPHVSITFNRPMVEVTSQDDAAENVPVTLTPQPQGSWRWMGTRTLIFEPERVKLNNATDYTLVVHDNAQSIEGKTIGGQTTFSFSTPPPELKSNYPSGNRTPTNTPIFMTFNQKIDPDQIVRLTTVNTGDKKLPFRRGTLNDLTEEHEHIKKLAQQTADDHWVLLFTNTELPAAHNITVTIDKGVKSLEGPNKSPEKQIFSFRTYDPLTISHQRCNRNSDVCYPDQNWFFVANNKIEYDSFCTSMVEISPATEGLTIDRSGNRIWISGRKTPATEYTVRFSPEIKDVFGQSLNKAISFDIKVGNDHPRFFSNNSRMSVVDPSSKPSFRVSTVNYKNLAYKVWHVSPSDYSTYNRIPHYRSDDTWLNSVPGTMVTTDTVAIKGDLNSIIETEIDLSSYLSGTKGHLIVWVSPTEPMKGSRKSFFARNPHAISWLQVTNIGLDAWTDPTSLLVMATSLDAGAPLANVKVIAGSKEEVTGEDGISGIKLSEQSSPKLIAVNEADSAFLPMHLVRNVRSGQALFHVFDDRGMYRPGEEVHIKGRLRTLSQDVGADIELPNTEEPLLYVVFDSRRNEIARDTARLSSMGGFDFSFDIPSTPNLGTARIDLRTANHAYSHTFEIQEFRAPEFEVQTSTDPGPHFLNKALSATVKGSYYAGGGLSGAPVNWTVRTDDAYYTPPNRHEYSFGEQLPWFWGWYVLPSRSGSGTRERFEGVTDFSGEHNIDITVRDKKPPRPVTLTVEGSVTDVNRQQWTSSTSTLIHPASYYVGLKTDQYSYAPGDEVTVDWIVTDVDGNAIENVEVHFRAERIRTVFRGGTRTEEVVESVDHSDISTDDASQWTFTPSDGGTWKLTAVVTDNNDRHNYTAIRRWVRDPQIRPAKRVETQDIMIFPDKDSYAAGDTAKLTIQTPFAPSEGVVLLKRHGFEEQRRFTLDKTSKVISIPIKERYTPNIHVEVHISGVAPRENRTGKVNEPVPKQPALANGSINLPVPPSQRTLNVVAEAEKESLSPGESTNVAVTVKDAGGDAVRDAEVTVLVVDEAILALSNYQMRDPIEVFYRTRPPMVRKSHNRPYIILTDDSELDAIEPQGGSRSSQNSVLGAVSRSLDSAPRMMAMELSEMEPASEESSSPVTMRTDFNPLAAFTPAGKTDSSGTLNASVKLPDNLTRYRIMVIASEGSGRFGVAESNMTARLPLMVRPSAPRFLNFGDNFELPVVLQNQTDDDLTVDVVTRAQNAALHNQGYKVQIPSNDRVEVRFPASTVAAGTARFQVMASTEDGFSDASAFELPVWTPAKSEAFATYGTIDSGAVSYSVKHPAEIWPQFGGVTVSTSSTALQALTDAFIYLYTYKFAGSEQIASRIISIVALQDVLEAFNIPDIPSPDEIQKQLKTDIETLASRQNRDGGFGFWRLNQRSHPFTSLHVIHALNRALEKGYEIPSQVKRLADSYLTNIERHIPSYYSPQTRRTVIAYSLYVRSLDGDHNEKRARNLLKEAPVEEWSIGALGWLLYTLSGSPQSSEVNAIIQHLENRVHETASTAQFTTRFSEQDHLIFHSSRRSDAIVLEALIKARPQSDLIVKLVRGLLAHRKAGRWGNTQENGFVLLALDSYFAAYESQTPDFVARAWLGSQYAGDHAFRGRTAETHQITIPMHFLADQDTSENLTLLKEGAGRMYYRVGMNYAPKSLRLDPADHGFHVERQYEGMDNKEDVTLRSDGTWEIKAGTRVKVTVTMVAPGRRYHVALIDPLPAGLEPLNPSLAVTADLPEESTRQRFWWWSRPWYEHQNMRDERVEAFASLLYGGVYEYTYYARATTPGEFIVPPAKAEEMYAPETFGRSGSNVVIVK
ncbi:alpha-2-macroglobulin family protein [Chitinispirillales bacterium ANBcel5]|uniref:alpha-2-macroglobulin family protein n=1 Tax=Cellulosispirillum alkaliphilum TaxID=3039283 RepID=UPI002A5200A0|nr:alpha-2-macroglobulin family protein [Chitinispirillales bacterium ANBcel5]